ncbi:Sulfotransferase [Melia azedarach]|uniref:Sulfotransferase n=1 Tax=Melia azedarach TaxID=155640 RepID=A0ACC1XUQ0_MELAZ|nr:Sulfotransferase [Melia azedarach]
MWIQQQFKTRSTDVYLITHPKSGTTWLKGLIFSIMNRHRYDFTSHPLLTFSPHDVVPFMEVDLFKSIPIADPEILLSPRILATHIPYTMLPESIKNSSCPVVYIGRNPKDVLVSLWQFMIKLKPKDMPPISLEDAFDLFCKGISPCGPVWDHALGYWKASIEYPNKILFLKYEEMKKDPLMYTKRLAEFLGHTFSLEEEANGIVEEIVKLCSFENMRNLQVNKTGQHRIREANKNDVFFREATVGDWKNHLTTEMVEALDQITEHKFDGSGLFF